MSDWWDDFEARWKLQPWHVRLKYAVIGYYNEYLYNWTPRQLYRRAKWFYQRGTRGWSDRDTWSFDYYLAGVIAGGVMKLREGKLGHPCDPELCRCVGDPPECCEGTDGLGAWQDVLLEMAVGFQDYKKYDLEHWISVKPMLDKSLGLFARWFPALWS